MDRRMRAIVADDEPEIRAIITEYLDHRGFEVTPAADGVETLAHVKRVQPDVIVLDLIMPRLGGVETLAYLRQHFPDIAVIVLTGTPDDALRGRVVALGAAALLPKPLDLALLEMIIGTVTTLQSGAMPRAGQRKAGGRQGVARVLIVDDEPAIREEVAEYLEGERYETAVAADGVLALRQIIDAPPQVVVLDLRMPGLGGIEALTAIRAIAPSTQVIMMSDSEDTELARRALSYGAFDYARKPLDLAYLSRSIEAALNLSL